MLIQSGARRVAGHHRPLRRVLACKAGAPTGMGDIDDDTKSVHLADDGVTEITQAAVVRLARAVANRVPAIIGEVHHSDAELLKNSDVLQLVAHVVPAL